MASSLLQSPAQLSPSTALRISQQAPALLTSSSSRFSIASVYPFSLLPRAESAETWIAYEHLLLSCLRTQDDRAARVCLKRLTDRFGPSNERVMALKGMYEEAVAKDNAELEKVLRGYESTLAEDPSNIAIAKRRVALLRSLARPEDAIPALVSLLDISPTDAEAWSELSELYLEQGMHQQAIFSLEEVLLIVPNAWNIHARMGEITYIAAMAKDPAVDDGALRLLFDSVRWFCRSIELCDDYLRGYYGLKLVTDCLLSLDAQVLEKASEEASNKGRSELAPPSQATLKRLNKVATDKLADIVRRSSNTKRGGGAGSAENEREAEIIAAKQLLEQEHSAQRA